jgi:hypothetical protein
VGSAHDQRGRRQPRIARHEAGHLERALAESDEANPVPVDGGATLGPVEEAPQIDDAVLHALHHLAKR